MHRALWLWADGYITKESHDSGKLTKSNGIMKVRGQDGKFTKATNFSKDQWDAISDMHTTSGAFRYARYELMRHGYLVEMQYGSGRPSYSLRFGHSMAPLSDEVA